MRKEMKLRCEVYASKRPDHYKCVTKLFDGTSLEVTASQYEVLRDEEPTEEVVRVNGWLQVMQESQQGDVVSVTLPQPSLLYGRKVNVSVHDLMPLNSSIKDFNPSKPVQK